MSINDSTAQPSVYPKTAVAEQYEDRILTQAANDIYKQFGDVVSFSDKGKTLRKFGRNTAVAGTFETVWNTGGVETYVTGNDIVRVVSTSTDTQEVVIEGHTISNGELLFSTQTVTLTGTTPVTLPTPLARVTRLYNNDTTDFAGTITIEESDATVHLTVGAGDNNQSQKCSTSISNSDYYILTELQTFVFTKTSETVEFRLQVRKVGTSNKVFRTIFETTTSNTVPVVHTFNPPLIIEKNSDVIIQAKSDGTSVDVGAAFNGYLAIVKD